MRRLCLALLLLAATALPAAADQSWKQSSSVWARMNKCAQAALKAFPDYTPQGNAQREAQRQKCLREGNLPDNAVAAPSIPPAGAKASQ
jgi:hypothetical protein